MSSKCRCGYGTELKHIYGVDTQLFRAQADVRYEYGQLTSRGEDVFIDLQELSWTSIHVEICSKLTFKDIGCLDLQRELDFWHSVVQREVSEHELTLQEMVNLFFKHMETYLVKALELQLEGTHKKACKEATICDESEDQQSQDPHTALIALIKSYSLKGCEYYKKTLQKFDTLRDDIISELNGFIHLLLRDKYNRGTSPMLERMKSVCDSLRPREQDISLQLYVLSAMREARLELQRRKQASGTKVLKKEKRAHKSYTSSEILVERGEIKGRKVIYKEVPNYDHQSDCYKVTRYYSQ